MGTTVLMYGVVLNAIFGVFAGLLIRSKVLHFVLVFVRIFIAVGTAGLMYYFNQSPEIPLVISILLSMTVALVVWYVSWGGEKLAS